jgi:hypothetical protein
MEIRSNPSESLFRGCDRDGGIDLENLIVMGDKESHIVDGHFPTHGEKHALHIGLGSKFDPGLLAVVHDHLEGRSELGGGAFVRHGLEDQV